MPARLYHAWVKRNIICFCPRGKHTGMVMKMNITSYTIMKHVIIILYKRARLSRNREGVKFAAINSKKFCALWYGSHQEMTFKILLLFYINTVRTIFGLRILVLHGAKSISWQKENLLLCSRQKTHNHLYWLIDWLICERVGKNMLLFVEESSWLKCHCQRWASKEGI